MTLELYLAFIAASAALILLPGPNVSLIVATSLAEGTRRALLVVAGTSAAQAAQLLVVTVGLTPVMLLMADWFEVVRWAGVAYLLWLGWRLWTGRDAAEGNGRRRAGAVFGRGFVVAATNPKVLVFLAAFLPQFVDPAHPPAPQLALLAVSYFLVAVLLDSGWAILGGRLALATAAPRWRRLRDRIGATLFFGTALGLALARRS